MRWAVACWPRMAVAGSPGMRWMKAKRTMDLVTDGPACLDGTIPRGREGPGGSSCGSLPPPVRPTWTAGVRRLVVGEPDRVEQLGQRGVGHETLHVELRRGGRLGAQHGNARHVGREEILGLLPVLLFLVETVRLE